MFQVKIIDWFSAGHCLRGYRGECEKIHGHNFKVELVVEGENLNSIGLLIDFKELKQILKNTLSELDHSMLNEHPFFSKNNPSSENLAKYIFENLKNKLPKGLKLAQTWVWESEKAGAGYQP